VKTPLSGAKSLKRRVFTKFDTLESGCRQLMLRIK
jgi:hypothetical protein